MDTFILLISIALLVAAIRSHVMAQAHVTTKVKREWFDRLFTGDRASREHLTEEGLHHRKQSNLYALGGGLLVCVYIWLRSTS